MPHQTPAHRLLRFFAAMAINPSLAPLIDKNNSVLRLFHMG
jgi:hypothetical protein